MNSVIKSVNEFTYKKVYKIISFFVSFFLYNDFDDGILNLTVDEKKESN